MTALEDVIARVDAFVTTRMSAIGPPAAALAITDREQTLAVRTYGFASLESQVPLDPSHLFQIGSIGKSFTALVVLQEFEAGRLDLQQPITDFLDWVDLPQKMRPVTLHHLLSHTSGLVTGHESSPDPRWEVLSLRETDIGFPPGTRFWYSNANYKLLGFVLEKLSGQPYSQIIRQRIFEPLGMNESVASIGVSDRLRTAVPYVRLHDDRPGRIDDPWVPATWIESESGDGSICATIGDAATYLRMLLNGGRYPGGFIVGDESFALMTRAYSEDLETPGDWYGYGLATRHVDDHRYVGHYGGMIGHHCVIMSDMEAGVGVALLHSGNVSTERGMLFAMETMRAFRENRDLPAVPEEFDPRAVPDAAAFGGVYRNGDGEAITLSAESGMLLLEYKGETVAMERRQLEDDAFLVRHPAFDWTLMRVVRQGGAVAELTHGRSAWVNDNAFSMASAEPSFPSQWTTYPGLYRTWSPWYPDFRIVLRRGRLFMLRPDDSVEAGEEELELFQLPNGSLHVGVDEGSPGRIRFDTVIGKLAWRATFDNVEYQRFHQMDAPAAT